MGNKTNRYIYWTCLTAYKTDLFVFKCRFTIKVSSYNCRNYAGVLSR